MGKYTKQIAKVLAEIEKDPILLKKVLDEFYAACAELNIEVK